ncbi:GtrA family protein [Mesorhizobium sp. KR1-2]|uniref:GtrA family protein n=1 Tax=Mesorhizobium sp. KR1-2 TaxID=3156609 RepID=UPI0032B3562E
MRRVASFAFAGGVGFLADGGALALLLATTALGPFAARLVSIGFALTVTWLLNRHLTFGPSGRHIAAEGARYGGVGIATSLVNYLAYSLVMLALPATLPLAALAAASLLAMTLSFVGYSRLVFDR